MPEVTEREEIIANLDELEYNLLTARIKNLRDRFIESEVDEDSDDEAPELIVITPPTPITPFLSDFESEMDIDSDSLESIDRRENRFRELLGVVRTLRDEVERSRVLNRTVVPPLRASQLHLPDLFADLRPYLFRKKVRVDPDVFDCILDQIGDHEVFGLDPNHPQLPVAIQLAIFLNRAGHCGNTMTPEDVAQWAGVSVGSVINCTNRTMVAILAQHNKFVVIPTENSPDAELARSFVEAKSCEAWRGGIFAADGSTFNLFQKPTFYGDTFVDRKGRYSLNCQLVVMPHNFLVVDYCLGHPGSIHDAYAFQGTRLAKAPQLIPDGHWIWADSAYPTKPWCVVPFKGTRNTPLLRPQKVYNRHLSKIQVCVEHAFAALKGRFQSLRELRLQIRSQDDIKYAAFWVQCCIILHNMIIRFEEKLGKVASAGWARQEASDDTREIDPVMVTVPTGTPGQRFRVDLMRELFTALGRHEFLVNLNEEGEELE